MTERPTRNGAGILVPSVERPGKSKEQLIRDEREGEAYVDLAELELRRVQIAGTPEEVEAAENAVDDARRDSLRIRRAMREGLDQWHRYDGDQELKRTAKEMGISR